MTRARVAVPTAVALLTLALGGGARASEGMPGTAFLFEARLGGVSQIVQTSNGFATAFPSALFGARLAGRVHVGLAFSYLQLPGGQFAGQSSAYTIVPSFGVDLVKATDERVAFYFQGGIPVGGQTTSPTPALPSSGDRFLVGFTGALGVRYAPHPMFAVGVEAGLFGLFAQVAPGGYPGTYAVFGALVGSFLYGK